MENYIKMKYYFRETSVFHIIVNRLRKRRTYLMKLKYETNCKREGEKDILCPKMGQVTITRNLFYERCSFGHFWMNIFSASDEGYLFMTFSFSVVDK